MIEFMTGLLIGGVAAATLSYFLYGLASSEADGELEASLEETDQLQDQLTEAKARLARVKAALEDVAQ